MSLMEAIPPLPSEVQVSAERTPEAPALDLEKFYERLIHKRKNSPSIEHVEAIEATESMSGAERYASVAYIVLVLNGVVKTPDQLDSELAEANAMSASTSNPQKVARKIDEVNQETLFREFILDLLPIAATQASEYQRPGNFSARLQFHSDTKKFNSMGSLSTLKTLAETRSAIGNITRKGTEDTLRVMAQMIDQKVNPPEEETTELHAVE